jgi:malonyl-CoA/methylmalonyl-CoA synthetase
MVEGWRPRRPIGHDGPVAPPRRPADPVPRPPSWAVHLLPGSDPDALDLAGEGSLPAAWARRWAAAPDRHVLHGDRIGWISAGHLDEATRDAASRMAAAGAAPGDRVVVLGRPSVDLVAAHVGALRLGLAVVPLNPAATASEIAHVVADARPAVAVVDAGLHATLRTGLVATVVTPGPRRPTTLATSGTQVPPAPARAAAPVEPTVLILGDDVGLYAKRRAPTGDDVTRAMVLDTPSPADLALLLYTSGTTGVPKGVPLTHANLLAGAEALRIAWRWTPEDRLILSLPLFHLHGLGVGLHGSLLSGGQVLLRPGFAPDDVAAVARAESATLFFGVPTMYSRLVSSGHVGALRRMRLCVSGSAPLAPDLHATVLAESGQSVLERYGMTETLMIASNPCDGERRPGTVGFPLPGVELHLDGEHDEIVVRGPNVFSGYARVPGAPAAGSPEGPPAVSPGAPPGGSPEGPPAVSPEGWFGTGDLGAVDADGYLRIVGRAKELVITGGANVYPREVEEMLRTVPGVADAAVIGVAHRDWGEEVVAVVEGDAAAAVVDEACRQLLAPYKRPKRVVVVDALPRNALGKVRKEELRRLFTDG